MKSLNLPKSALRVWCQMICYDNSTMSTTSLGTLYGLSDCCCSRCLCVEVLALLRCNLLRCLAFRSYRLARRGPLVVISWTTTNILGASHLI